MFFVFSFTSMIVYWTKNTLKIFDPWTWCTKKPFGYRVAHHGYLLTSCPGLIFVYKPSLRKLLNILAHELKTSLFTLKITKYIRMLRYVKLTRINSNIFHTRSMPRLSEHLAINPYIRQCWNNYLSE